MSEDQPVEIANKALFEALMSQGCSPVEAAAIANADDPLKARPASEARAEQDEMIERAAAKA